MSKKKLLGKFNSLKFTKAQIFNFYSFEMYYQDLEENFWNVQDYPETFWNFSKLQKTFRIVWEATETLRC